MVFESFSHTESDDQTGNIIRLEAMLKQIQVAKTQSEVYLADDVKNNMSTADDVGNPATSPL